MFSLLAVSLVSCRPASAPASPKEVLVMTQTPVTIPSQPPTPVQLRILALGDSYTIGEGVAVEDRWPVQLAGRLREQGLPVAEPQIIARTGWTTGELSQAIDQAQPEGPFDLVTLLIGVNNQYRGRSLAEYQVQFRDLLNRAVALAGREPRRVLVLSIPDWGVTPFARGQESGRIAAEIDAFNQASREETLSAGARYVEITDISRQVGAEAELLAADGLHPSGKMYAAWVERALPVVLEMLAR